MVEDQTAAGIMIERRSCFFMLPWQQNFCISMKKIDMCAVPEHDCTREQNRSPYFPFVVCKCKQPSLSQSDMQLPSPGQLTLFFKEHLSNPHFACSWDSPTHQIVRTLPSNKPPFQYAHFTSYHPPWVNRGFIKGEAMRLL